MKKQSNRLIFCLLLALLYLFGAICFAEQRIIFLDNALHIFNSDNTGNVGIMAGRWPIAIVRIPMWLAMQVKVSLNNIIYIYSISHALLIIGIGVFILVESSRSNFKLFLFTYLIVLGHTFFWNVSEIIPAILLSTFFFNQNRFNAISHSILIVLIIFSHPQGIIALIFIFIYQFLQKKDTQYLIPLILSIGTYLIKSLFFSNWYDKMKMGVLSDGLLNNPIGFIDNTSTSLVLGMWSIWILPITIILLSMTILCIKKKWMLLIWVSICSIGIAYLFIMSNPQHVSPFYLESNLYLFSFIAGTVLIDNIKKQKLLDGIILIAFLYAIIKICFISKTYTNRLDYLRSISNHLPDKKNIIERDELNINLLKLDWGLPFETMILTTMDTNNTTKTAVSLNNEEIKKQFQDKNLLNGMGGSFEISNKLQYFKFDTTHYKIVKIKGGPERK